MPSGWNHWAGFASDWGTYNYYNATPWNCSFARDGTTPASPCEWTAMTGVHQADFVGQWGVQQMQRAVADGLPFFVHLTPLMVHSGVCYGPFARDSDWPPEDPYHEANLTRWGCDGSPARPCDFEVSPCVSAKHRHAFDGQANPHLPSYNASAAGPLPDPMGPPTLGPISEWVSERQDVGFRNRSASLLDLDALIGVVLDGLDALGVADETFFIFTSDNGYHMGEHRMTMWKWHPYSTDVSVPMYVAGPGVPRAAVLEYPTTHVDITAMVVDLAGARVLGPPLDGLSFAAAFTASPPAPAQWRDFQFSEHHTNAVTWRQVRRPLGGANATYTMWCGPSAKEEVFELAADPYELNNTALSSGAGFAAANRRLAAFLFNCSGAECNDGDAAADVAPFACYNVTPPTLDKVFDA